MGSEAVLTWRVPSLLEARGFVFYVVDFDPPRSAGRRKKRQNENALCPPSFDLCRVPVQLGGVTVSGLDPNVMYTITIVAENEDGERGEDVRQTCMCMQPF